MILNSFMIRVRATLRVIVRVRGIVSGIGQPSGISIKWNIGQV